MSSKPFRSNTTAVCIPWCSEAVTRMLVLGMLCLAVTARASLQFDVFIGYDGLVREISYFPVVFEVLNDGPAFKGAIEFNNSQFGTFQKRRIVAEFPTNTRKRFVLPGYASSRFGSWEARLVDDRDKVRAEQTGLRPRRDIIARGFILGGMPRTFGGMPTLPELNQRQAETTPAVGHLRPELFPDNPITLEGLDALYLNSEKALELKAPQVQALRHWLHQGGHLIICTEQPADVLGTPWLRELMPLEVSTVVTQRLGNEILDWMRQTPPPDELEPEATRTTPPPGGMSQAMRRRYGLPPAATTPPTTTPSPAATVLATDTPWSKLPQDSGWEDAVGGIVTGTLSDGQVMLAAGPTPLIVSAPRGRGRVTALLFNPEREPFRGWKPRPWLWARVARIPQELLRDDKNSGYGGWSIDGVLGAMIDSKQVRKLPISWLLALLVLYLAVIGPVDQYVLKRLNKQMWTWVTFPIYVVSFSLLIYFISFKLRSGETELNELHFVDLYPHQEQTEMRGRTFVSIYSPANARFALQGDQPFATLRGESQGPYSGGAENSRADIEQHGNQYRATVFVPVWTSQLFVNDWWQSASSPLVAGLTERGGQVQLQLTNLTGRVLREARLVFKGKVYAVGELAAGKPLSLTLPAQPAATLRDFVSQHAADFQMAADERRRAFGGDPARRQWNLPLCSMAASFIGCGEPNQAGYGGFLTPAGLDLSPRVRDGEAFLLAWDDGGALVRPSHQFQPRRLRRDTLLRLSVPIHNPL